MTLSFAEYLRGALELGVLFAAFAYAAWRLRRAALPGWTGAPARLVEIVVGAVLALWAAEAIGTFSAFTDLGILVAALVIAALAALAAAALERRTPPGPAGSPPAPPASGFAWTLAALVCAAVAAAWTIPTLQALAAGMDRADSLWYHMPLAATWMQTGDLGAIKHFDPIFFAAYYPANSEVFHAIPLLAFGRDIVSPVLNVGFLAIGLLAAYCIGRPYALGPHALIGGAVALGSQQQVEFQAGEALNDITGVAFILAAVAIVVNAYPARNGSPAVPSAGGGRLGKAPSGTGRFGEAPAEAPQHGREDGAEHGRGAPPTGLHRAAPVLAAGLAAGVAAGTKLSFLAPVAALALGVAWLAGRGADDSTSAGAGLWRWGGAVRALGWFGLAAFAAGGYWYVRNAAVQGNPIPFTPWGPLDLPAPERAFELREPFSVAHYATDFDVWWDWFFPALDSSFGFLWPLVIASFLGAGVYALWRGTPVMRALGFVVLATALAYVFTPLTAAGEEGEPISFEWNVRYIAPAVAIGVSILPVLFVEAARSRRRPGGPAPATARSASLALVFALAVSALASLIQWGHGHVKGAVAAGLLVLCAFVAAAWLRDRNLLGPAAPRRATVALASFLGLGALAAGWFEQDHYLTHRYENLSPELRIAQAARWGRDLEDAKVAVSGVRGVFNQYAFYGADLSNDVQWLGLEGEDGAFLRIPDCETWRSELAAGGYTHVVTMYDPYNPYEAGLTDTKEALWTRRDEAAREVLRDGPVSVFALDGTPDPGTCGSLPDLTEPELNGDSVNIVPSANQP